MSHLNYLDVRTFRTFLLVHVTVKNLGICDLVPTEESFPGRGSSFQRCTKEMTSLLYLEMSSQEVWRCTFGCIEESLLLRLQRIVQFSADVFYSQTPFLKYFCMIFFLISFCRPMMLMLLIFWMTMKKIPSHEADSQAGQQISSLARSEHPGTLSHTHTLPLTEVMPRYDDAVFLSTFRGRLGLKKSHESCCSAYCQVSEHISFVVRDLKN